MTEQAYSIQETRPRGRLKIFLGYAPGVGTTYAMLEAARQRKQEGVDVVAGCIQARKLSRTPGGAEEALAGFEAIPQREVVQEGADGEAPCEMDLDAVLARRPQLALVDELAHVNAPGTRHPRRYQDVQELLAAGIDVYTTLNIHHLESLNDVVWQITGVKIHTTLPDRVVDDADEIELVDLPPDELIRRLHEGKVHIFEGEPGTAEKFYRKGNLFALREIALRRAAAQVDGQMRDYMQRRAIAGPWPATERILVCVSPSPASEQLVRAARRLAEQLNAEWTAVYVEAPSYAQLTQEKRDQVSRALRLAEELGGRALVLPLSNNAPGVAGTIIEYARKSNITKIVAGKAQRARPAELLRLLTGGTVVDQLIQRSGNIDVYVIHRTAGKPLAAAREALWPHRPWIRYIWSLVFVAIGTGVSSLVVPEFSPTNLVMIYLLTVVLAAVYLGRGPAILASFTGVLAFDYFFVPPAMTLNVEDTEYLLTFAGLLVVSVVISYLTVRAQEQAEAAERRQADMAFLYGLTRDLAAAEDLETTLKAVFDHVEQALDCDVVVFLPENDGLRALSKSPAIFQGEADHAAAGWAFQHGAAAGWGSDTWDTAQGYYLPLKTARQTLGVLGARPRRAADGLPPEQRRLLEAFASQSAQAIERVQLAAQARQVKLLQAAEKLQNALLNSISHDLRTPLVSVTGALSALDEQGDQLEAAARRSLVETARQEADRLNRLVGNLLEMTRLEAGALHAVKEPCEAADLVGAALGQVEGRLGERAVQVDIAADFPLIEADFVLIVHVLVNLLDNALKYSPEGSPLAIRAWVGGNEARLAVLDRGEGIPAEDLERVFDKFYRVQRPEPVAGTGLGLAICKGIVEAHGGRTWAENREGGGTVMVVALPI